MIKNLWVYEFHLFGEGEQPDVSINVEKVKVKGYRLWNGEPIYYDVNSRHKGITVQLMESVLSTDNKRIKRIWLKQRNDKMAKALFCQYVEERIEFYARCTEHIKSVGSIVKNAEVISE